jgi:hypothetical protein
MVKTLVTALVFVALCGLMVSATSGHTLASHRACVLLVDDDQDGPDVRSYYISALDELSIAYDVWDIVSQGDPSADDLMGHQIVIWFTGYPRSDTFTSSNEAAVATYLDAGGRFWLVSEDYLYDRGLTSFGQDRLYVNSYTNDVNRTDPQGAVNTLANGLGPYGLTPPDGWPGDLYTDDIVTGHG